MSKNRTDKLIQELRDRAAEFGFVLAGRCRHCMRPVSSLRSLKDRSGPVCKSKHQEEEPDGTPVDLHATDS